MSLIREGRWSYRDDNVEENGVDIFVDGDEWVVSTYPSNYSPAIQRIRAAQIVNYANGYEKLEQENIALRNQMQALESELASLREALATIKYHAKDTPSDFDISVIQNTADRALEDK